MIEETAFITSCDGAFAQVETQRTTSCGQCQANSTCGTSLLNRFFGYRKVSVKALNPIDAEPGDEVVVGLEESALTQASVMFYLVPILLLIGGAGCGQWLAEWFNFSSTEPVSVVGGLLGLLIGLYWARYSANKINLNNRHQAVILRAANTCKVELQQ